MTISISFFEIYNEQGYDLLNDCHAEKDYKKWEPIQVFEIESGELQINNLSLIEVKNEKQAFNLFVKGNNTKKKTSTPMNPSSS